MEYYLLNCKESDRLRQKRAKGEAERQRAISGNNLRLNAMQKVVLATNIASQQFVNLYIGQTYNITIYLLFVTQLKMNDACLHARKHGYNWSEFIWNRCFHLGITLLYFALIFPWSDANAANTGWTNKRTILIGFQIHVMHSQYMRHIIGDDDAWNAFELDANGAKRVSFIICGNVWWQICCCISVCHCCRYGFYFVEPVYNWKII